MEAKVEAVRLSRQARALWGKSDYGEEQSWLPLYVHACDVALVAGGLWDYWVPRGTKAMLARSLGDGGALAECLFIFLAAVHDIGKATPAFQAMPCHRSAAGDAVSLAWKAEHAGLPIPPYLDTSHAPKHPVAGQVIVEDILQDACGLKGREARCLTSIIGCHHGTPSDNRHLLEALEPPRNRDVGLDSEPWRTVQRELFDAALQLAGLSADDLGSVARLPLPPFAASVLTGLVIMADWMASDQDAFPLLPLTSGGDAAPTHADGQLDGPFFRERLDVGWRNLGLLPCWSESPADVPQAVNLYGARFDLPTGARPRPMQLDALDVARSIADPGLLVVEAPMGEGKTEAALAAAEVLAARTGAGGVCVALPTMATTDAMFGRVHAWLEGLPECAGAPSHSTYLAHGKAQLNEEYRGIVRTGGAFAAVGQDLGEPRAVVSSWMCGRKRGMLVNFVVCTVDQVLMGALQMKHLPLRQLSLANKVVVIDECHAYDAYMRQYLCDVLEWLGSWHTPVILLSATLPSQLRESMVAAYLRGRNASSQSPAAASSSVGRGLFRASAREASVIVPPAPEGAYPLLTVTDGSDVTYRTPDPSGRSCSVRVRMLADDIGSLTGTLSDLLTDGGCAGVVCSTVRRAQEAYGALAALFGSDQVTLVHARFTDVDRMENERIVRELLGPGSTCENGMRPWRHVVVGTQVLEQSLDIDFDVMVTDAAPVDLLFQRLGRVHRHQRETRPARLQEALCLVRGVESWTGGVPAFPSSVVAHVYERATLMESLAVCGLLGEDATCMLELPADIARLVRRAYGPEGADDIPDSWSPAYGEACEARKEVLAEKERRAKTCLLKTPSAMFRNGDSLTNWFSARRMIDDSKSPRDEDRGPRAVRDTQETVEVLALRLTDDSRVALLPWIGDERRGIDPGSVVPTSFVPGPDVAQVAAQSTVRLPLELCSPDRIDWLVSELEDRDARYVGAWQESPWLEGQLALFMQDEGDGVFGTDLCGWRVRYCRLTGLTVEKLVDE